MSDSKDDSESTETNEGPEHRPAESQIPPHMRPTVGAREGSTAARPGFRNPANVKSKASRRKKKGRKR